jgi:hypothetical protein
MNLEGLGCLFIEENSGWMDTRLKFIMPNACTFSGSQLVGNTLLIRNTIVEIDRLLVGYKLYKEADSELYLEFGRAKMEHLFDSRIQYKSYFNGIQGAFTKGNLHLHGGQLAIDWELDHYGFIGEAILSNVNNSNLTITYSITDWVSEEDYLISQFSAKQYIDIVMDNEFYIYAAFMRNHRISSHSNAIYAGATLGEIKKMGDWTFDANYQYIGVNSVPTFDLNGIGFGHGVQIKAGVGITDNLSLNTKIIFADMNRVELCAHYKW